MAYYTSTNKADLKAYNTLVVNSEGYDGVYTTDWATIIEHPNGSDYAILKHDSYNAPLIEEEGLGAEWYPATDI